MEIVKWPRSNLSFLLAWEYDPGEGSFLDPPIDVMEYNEIAISVTNTGEAPITGTVYETALPIIFASDVRGSGWSPMLPSLDIGARETRRLELFTRGRSFLRIFLKRSDLQKPTSVNVVVSYQ
jgi:hypothetical protein